MLKMCLFIGLAFILGFTIENALNSRVIEDLKEEHRKVVDKKEERIEELSKNVDRYRKIIGELTEIKSSTPEGCKMGDYCRGCVHVKSYVRYASGLYGDVAATYYCGKAETCKNFIQKEI